MKLCNICDTPLVAGNICPVCRKVCRSPIEISDKIHLNSSHSSTETGCDYHQGDRKISYLNKNHPEGERDCAYHDNREVESLMQKLSIRKKPKVRHRKATTDVNLIRIVMVIVWVLIVAMIVGLYM